MRNIACKKYDQCLTEAAHKNTKFNCNACEKYPKVNLLNSEKIEKEKKYCPHCNDFKPVEDFGEDQSNKDGKACWCKDCRSKKESARYFKKQIKTGKIIKADVGNFVDLIGILEEERKRLLVFVHKLDHAIEALK